MGGPSKTIVWFRRDLRIDDNPALAEAARDGSVLPVFLWCREEEGQFYPGRVSRWWLKQSLECLDQGLTSLGSPLVVIKAASTLSALLQCISATGATRVVYNRLYDPVSLVRDHDIKKQLMDFGIEVKSFNGDLLYEPWEAYDDNGHAFTVFDEFWSKCLSLPIDPAAYLPPLKLSRPPGAENIKGFSIEELGLENVMEKSSNGILKRAWSPGWGNADKMMNGFLQDHLQDYLKNRMKLEGNTTSLLSIHLHYGEISVKKLYQSLRIKQIQWTREGKLDAEESVDLFLRSIGLREYSRYLCFNFPFTHERSLLGNLKHYPWNNDEVQFKMWRQGRTGYPLVDAGMRELWATGWIHNRMRVIVASFCVKYLLLPWRWGMKYFWDTLLDADLESDILGWQYVSGSLPDGHKLERLDTPEIQGSRFDPEGEYVRHWIPELARMPTEWIHHPWDAPESVLKAAGVELGLNYPKPMVEVSEAKERLSEAIAVMWQLDRAEKMNGLDEGVADNSIVINNLDIPKVIPRREAECTSSFDLRVPSLQNFKDQSPEKRKCRDLDHRGLSQYDEEVYIQQGECEVDRELWSTAESSSAQKQSISESQHAVPMPSLSSSFKQGAENVYGSPTSHFFVGSPSVRPWIEVHSLYKARDYEEEADAQSVNENPRPCKRPAIDLGESK